MNEQETVTHDNDQLDRLEQEIKAARSRLNDETHQEEDEPLFYEDDQEERAEPRS